MTIGAGATITRGVGASRKAAAYWRTPTPDALALALLAVLIVIVLRDSLFSATRLILGYDMDQPNNWEAYNRHATASGSVEPGA